MSGQWTYACSTVLNRHGAGMKFNHRAWGSRRWAPRVEVRVGHISSREWGGWNRVRWLTCSRTCLPFLGIGSGGWLRGSSRNHIIWRTSGATKAGVSCHEWAVESVNCAGLYAVQSVHVWPMVSTSMDPKMFAKPWNAKSCNEWNWPSLGSYALKWWVKFRTATCSLE